jgi:hypothetical protein
MADEQQTLVRRIFYVDAEGYDSIDKRPDEVIDLVVDYTTALAGDTISTSTFTVATGLTKGTTTSDTTSATVWVSAGTAGEKYLVESQVVTAAARTKDRQFRVYVKA